MTTQPQLWNLRRRRQGREAITALQPLVDTPHDLGSGPLRMPAGARLAISHSAGLSQGDVTVSLGNGAGFTHPALAADQVFRGVWAERGQDVTVTGVPSGTLTVHAIDPLDAGRTLVIATRVVA